MTPMEQALRLALKALLDEGDYDATWPPAVAARSNAVALLHGRLSAQDYLKAQTDRRVA